MAADSEDWHDWHRYFGLLLTDLFTRSPFTVEIERDLSQQKQLLDVVIIRRGRGRFTERLPDGLDVLATHNLLSFKSFHESLDDWAMKELIGHYVSYRKLVSPSPSDLLPEDQFRLYGVSARFPHNLSTQVPWQQRQAGVYDCLWGTDTVRVIVVRELPREPHNAPFHLFSDSLELVRFGSSAYRPRSQRTSRLLRQLYERFQEEGVAMSYTWEDFEREYVMKHFPKLTTEEQQKVLQSLPAEKRLAGLSEEQIRQYLERLTTGQKTAPRKPRRKK
jgi:hypothetical protein